jgi:ribosome-associated translation inhibitor RaiA
MKYRYDKQHLDIEIDAVDCQIPIDERARMQTMLADLAEAVRDFPHSHLRLKIIYHSGVDQYHVKGTMHLPGATLFVGDHDLYLDTALERAIRKLVRKIDTYREQPDRAAIEMAKRQRSLDQNIVAPQDADAGPLADAVRDGDYRRFRLGLIAYEDWLRKRAGRWVQRYPEAQAQVGEMLLLGDLVEEIYLNAFEQFMNWPTHVSLHDWLDSLIDPSLRAMLQHPDEEHAAASFARTTRETVVE